MTNSRVLAAQLCREIIDGGRSLDKALGQVTEQLSNEDRGFVQELVYGVCRWQGVLDATSQTLMTKPLRNKDRDVHYLLLVGLYQLRFINTAEHAAVSETVNGAKVLKKIWAVKLLNACLRRYQRELIKSAELPEFDAQLATQQEHQQSHPQWLAELIKHNWPEHWEHILSANNERPAMCLRVNQLRGTREEYLARLTEAEIPATLDPFTRHGLILDKPVSVNLLPGFDEGECSVQDTAAQIASELLAPRTNSRILDACAAPGGKLAHILEITREGAEVDALDVAPLRVDRIRSGLARLKLSANVYVADAAEPPVWPVPSQGYDQIIVDAPCSGTGVIRRHPDIRHHRRVSDIDALAELQAQILDNNWALLKQQGQLLYVTCSVLNPENESQIEAFLQRHLDASICRLTHPNAISLKYGCQTLPGVHSMDGFYYCLVEKR